MVCGARYLSGLVDFGGVLVFKVLKAFISDSTVKIVWSGVKPARVQQYIVVCDVFIIVRSTIL